MVTNAQAVESSLSLPRLVLDALSLPGIDAARFCAAADAFGPLPTDAQVDLANRLIRARGQYVVQRRFMFDREGRPGNCRERLDEIGSAAGKLLQLLHRDGADPRSSNLHPAVTLALPQLYRMAEERGSKRIWDDQGLIRLVALVADLAEAGSQAQTIFPAQFPATHGGRRRAGPDPATALVEHVIEIYGSMRTQYPASGPKPAFDGPLRRFVRAGLAFVVSPPPETIDSDGRRWQLAEASFLETDLPRETRITDSAIRGVFDRLHKSRRNPT